MKLETKFSCRDKVWIGRPGECHGPYLVGQVSVRYVAAQEGPDPDSPFDNKGRQQEKYEETYMFFETGVGSGYVYHEYECFGSLAEAQKEMARDPEAVLT